MANVFAPVTGYVWQMFVFAWDRCIGVFGLCVVLSLSAFCAWTGAWLQGEFCPESHFGGLNGLV